MQLASKHRTRSIIYDDFTGGINYSAPPEAIKNNEATIMLNWEFDPSSSVLKVRDGLTKLGTASDTINALYYSHNLNLLLAACGTTLCKWNGSSFDSIGTLSGNAVPIFAEWSNKVLVASGGKLQSTDGLTLTTITDSPDCDYVTTQAGRVVVSRAGDDYLYYSGIGDETNWNFEGTASDAVKLEVGYKDGGDITSVIALSKDIVVFKDNRRIYRVVGYYPDWVVYEISRDAGAITRLATLVVGNSVVFVDEVGVRSLDTVVEYGDVRVRDIGEKINSYVMLNLTADAALWHVRPKGQIWLKTQNDQFVYVYHYIQKAWSLFKFPDTVSAITYDENNVYVGIGSNLYKLDPSANDDDGTAIEVRLRLKRRLASERYLLKRIRAVYEGVAEGTASLRIGNLTKTLDWVASDDIAYYDDDIAYYDDDPLITQAFSDKRWRVNYRIDYVEPEVIVTSGKMKLLGLILEVAEV